MHTELLTSGTWFNPRCYEVRHEVSSWNLGTSASHLLVTSAIHLIAIVPCLSIGLT